MKFLNDLLRPLFDLLQAPLAGLPAFVGVLVWSIPVGVFALWVFGKTSNQERIAEVKRRIHAGLFEIRLFNDDLRAIMKAQWEILGHVLHYQALALKPMIFILPPLVLVMVQLHQFYGFRGLQPGDEALMTVQLDPAAGGRRVPARDRSRAARGSAGHDRAALGPVAGPGQLAARRRCRGRLRSRGHGRRRNRRQEPPRHGPVDPAVAGTPAPDICRSAGVAVRETPREDRRDPFHHPRLRRRHDRFSGLGFRVGLRLDGGLLRAHHGDRARPPQTHGRRALMDPRIRTKTRSGFFRSSRSVSCRIRNVQTFNVSTFKRFAPIDSDARVCLNIPGIAFR